MNELEVMLDAVKSKKVKKMERDAKRYKEAVAKIKANPDGPGRGRKQCPECKLYCGVRTKVCERCNHIFEQKESTPEVSEITKDERRFARSVGFTGKKFVFVIGGEREHLKSSDEDSVFIWADKLLNDGFDKNCLYTLCAIKHSAGHDLGFGTSEYYEACKWINEWYNSLLIDEEQDEQLV